MDTKPYKILIIDDSPSDRKIYKRFLNSQTLYEFALSEAGTIRAGLESCRSQHPDCVVLDYHLPDRLWKRSRKFAGYR